MISRIQRARRPLALLLGVAGLGLAVPALAQNSVIVQLLVDPAPLYEKPLSDRRQATAISTLEKLSELIPIETRRDDWIAIQVEVEGERELRWLHKDDVVVMGAPGRMARPPSCQDAAGRTMCSR